jgi:hypothetical protein
MAGPYWTCRLCGVRRDTWGKAREHLLVDHKDETEQLLAQAMIPEMMLLEKHVGE